MCLLWADTDHSRSKRQQVVKVDEDPGKIQMEAHNMRLRWDDVGRGWGEAGRLPVKVALRALSQMCGW